jgi:peroxiredoxin
MTMNPGNILAALAFVTVAANLATHYPKITGNRAPLRPRREQLVMIGALALVLAGLAAGPGIAGYALGGIAAVPALLFLLATATSGLPNQQLAVAVGAPAPDFSLGDAEGRPFRLSELRGAPVLLKFYRGYWCPYCVGELAQLDRYARDFAALGVRLVAVSSDRVDVLAPFRRKHDWSITLLADPALVAHRLYNVQSRKFAPRRGPFRDLAIPTTILIGADGRVLWLDQSADFRVRPQADMVLAKAKALLPGGADGAATCDACAA